jgi:NADP-dependent 3-hydroxy acid dehydrogenase YdfG
MQYETNIYGLVKVTNASLAYMRKRRSGTIVFIGSRSGWQTDVTVRFHFYMNMEDVTYRL